MRLRDLVGRDMMGLNGFKGAKQEGCFSGVGVGMKNYVAGICGECGWDAEVSGWGMGSGTR